MRTKLSNEFDVAVVGGGIAGLYCCYKLMGHKKSVVLLEGSDRFGGRIYTWPAADGLYAEFGPMRIEPDLQPYLNTLLSELGFKKAKASSSKPKMGALVDFPEYTAEDTDVKYSLQGTEAKQENTLALMKLAIIRILLLVDGPAWTRNPSHISTLQNIKRAFVREDAYWVKDMDAWMKTLKEEDFAELRKNGSFLGKPLYRMGFWNLLTDVLSHHAVLKIKDSGSFYHLLPENPNAVEWMIFWIRGFQTTQKLQGIYGGMNQIVDRLAGKIRKTADIRVSSKVVDISKDTNSSERLILSIKSGRETVKARHVILALPKRPIEHLMQAFPETIQNYLNQVFGFPLVKCFFVVRQPWWKEDHRPNRHATHVPTRELHYWRTPKNGMIMVYTDRPATAYWETYLTESSLTQDIAEIKEGKDQDPLVVEKFVQYVRQNGVHDFTPDRVLKYGIRDWGKDPYGGACHAWKPRAKSWEALEHLKAFGLRGNEKVRNIHVCGEAYSDYHGFLEGALRSSEAVLGTIN